MVWGYRYIQIDENGRVSGACADAVFVDGVEITIDTEGMTVLEMPTDAIYALYYNETDGLHWVKVADFEPETPSPTEDELQWQAITDLEISQMEYDQALTDLELAYLEGSAE